MNTHLNSLYLRRDLFNYHIVLYYVYATRIDRRTPGCSTHISTCVMRLFTPYLSSFIYWWRKSSSGTNKTYLICIVLNVWISYFLHLGNRCRWVDSFRHRPALSTGIGIPVDPTVSMADVMANFVHPFCHLLYFTALTVCDTDYAGTISRREFSGYIFLISSCLSFVYVWASCYIHVEYSWVQ